MTHKFARMIPVVALALCVSAFAQAGNAAAAAAPKVGIINIQAAIVSTNEGQRDFQTLQKKFDPKRTELEGLGKQVEDLKKQLNTQGDKLNDEARNTLVKQVDQKQKQLQRDYEDANNDLQGQQNEIASRIGQKMMEVVDKYAKDNGFTVIMDVSGQASPVLWAAESSDITKAIIDAYNAQSGVAAPPKAAAPAAGTTAPAAKPAAPKPATTPKTTPR